MKSIDDIIERNLNLVPYMINHMGLGKRFDDFVDVGWIGLVRGCLSYDEKQAKETTYLCTCIKYEILQQIAYEKRYMRDINVEILSIDYGDEECSFSNILASDFNIDNYIKLKTIIDDFAIVLSTFRKKSQNVLKDYFGYHTPKLNPTEISNKYNMTKSNMHTIVRLFRKKLKEQLQQDIDLYDVIV